MLTLGVDTSNYTTSIAISNDNAEILVDERITLKVKTGEIGLKQSDAFYQHLSNLNKMRIIIHPYLNDIDKIVVSNKPRNIKNSYMPVFNAGVFFTNFLNIDNRYKIKHVSHQEGHILSGMISNENLLNSNFFSLHISGGTTELLKVHRENSRFNIEIILKTLDLSFGQLIDRIGNEMGLDFPSGSTMDKYCSERIKTNLKISFKENGFNLSGIENKLKDEYIKNKDVKLISNLLFSYLLELIEHLENNLPSAEPILIIGGVGESNFLKKYLSSDKVYFAKAGLSSDNAVGLSLYHHFWRNNEHKNIISI